MLQLLLLFDEKNYIIIIYWLIRLLNQMNDKNIFNITSHRVIVHSNGIIVVIETNLILCYEKLFHRECC